MCAGDEMPGTALSAAEGRGCKYKALKMDIGHSLAVLYNSMQAFRHAQCTSDTSADLGVIFALSVCGIGLLFRQSESCLAFNLQHMVRMLSE